VVGEEDGHNFEQEADHEWDGSDGDLNDTGSTQMSHCCMVSP
jgi:hypothetical protein